MNEYYNKESSGGRKKVDEAYERMNGPKVHHYNRRHYPSVNHEKPSPANDIIEQEELSRSYGNRLNPKGNDYTRISPKNKFG